MPKKRKWLNEKVLSSSLKPPDRGNTFMNEVTQNPIFADTLIAPCGMNCGVCVAYLREKRPCKGCRVRSENKPRHCVTCRIANCDELARTDTGFCIDCTTFPCARMKQLDLRYRKNYQTSLIDNLKYIEQHGMGSFLNLEARQRTCPFCGNIVSIHRDFCIHCKKQRSQINK